MKKRTLVSFLRRLGACDPYRFTGMTPEQAWTAATRDDRAWIISRLLRSLRKDLREECRRLINNALTGEALFHYDKLDAVGCHSCSIGRVPQVITYELAEELIELLQLTNTFPGRTR